MINSILEPDSKYILIGSVIPIMILIQTLLSGKISKALYIVCRGNRVSLIKLIKICENRIMHMIQVDLAILSEELEGSRLLYYSLLVDNDYVL